MKKDKFDMSNLGLPAKPQMIAPSSDTQALLEKAVEDIHNPSPTPPQNETPKLSGEIKKVSMDLPMEMYKAVKFYSVESGISMKDYIAQLIDADMQTRKAKQ
jgi:hypothetical protein